MKEFNNKFKENMNEIFKNLSMEKAIVRLIIAWLFIVILELARTRKNFVSASYAGKVNLPMFVCLVILIFIALCMLGRFKLFRWIEIYAPMILITAYGFMSAMYCKDISFILGVSLFLAASIVYAVNKCTSFFEIKNRISVAFIYAIAASIFIIYVGVIAILRYKTYRNPNFDFGIWSQMFYYMKKSFAPLTTCERQNIGLMSHFRVHFSPIYYLFLPVYIVFPYPVTLNILQVLTLASAIIPVYLLCRKRNLSNGATALFGIIFVLIPALICGTFYDLHENCFLVPMILWLFYFIEKDNLKGMIIFTILTLLIKEDAPVYAACIGLFVIVGKKKYRNGVVIFVTSVVYFLVVMYFMGKYGLGIMDSRFTNYMADASKGGLIDVIRNFITNPAYVVEECFKPEKLSFMFYMIFPLGFLPLASKKVSGLILFIPVILENLASNYKYQYSINYQYVFGTVAILTYLAIVNYSELTEKTRRFMAGFAICMGIILLPVCAMQKSYYFDIYRTEKQWINDLDEAMKSIPDDASVVASTFFLPHLSNRDYIYEYPYDKGADYIVLDLRFNEIKEENIDDLIKSGYEQVKKIRSLYVILRKK